VNELVTNAVKYAFSQHHLGHIDVKLARHDANNALVSVQDDGIGLPDDFDFTKSKGLGLQIVATLAKQLGADIVRNVRATGNEFRVLVPCAQGLRLGVDAPEDCASAPEARSRIACTPGTAR
jgi:two-component sensor histidine kinase